MHIEKYGELESAILKSAEEQAEGEALVALREFPNLNSAARENIRKILIHYTKIGAVSALNYLRAHGDIKVESEKETITI